MIINLKYQNESFWCDLSKPIDLSIPVGQVKCFYATDFKKHPYVSGNFVGSIKEGAPVNFFNIEMNPHGNGTHTESLGHITEAQESINDILQNFHFFACLVSVPFQKNQDGDQFIGLEELKEVCPADLPEALIIRTLPNDNAKLSKDYSGTNPPYVLDEAMHFIVEKGIKHLLIDLPSVDKEVDDGILASHHIYWNVEGHKADENSRKDCTITEMIFVPNNIPDGDYLLNIQIPSINLDAAPSKPTIYILHEDK